VVKLMVLYGHPTSAADFEKYYTGTHMPLAEKVAGVRRWEFAKFTGTPDGGRSPYYRSAELYFDDVAQMQAVLASPEAERTVADIANFATGGVTIMVAEVL